MDGARAYLKGYRKNTPARFGFKWTFCLLLFGGHLLLRLNTRRRFIFSGHPFPIVPLREYLIPIPVRRGLEALWSITRGLYMLGLSYGEVFLLLGATAALIGPKDLPIIARTAGRLSGRAIGYVQDAHGQFKSVMQQSQARQVHKELQDTMAQLEAIRHEFRSVSFMNLGPLTTRLVDNVTNASQSPAPDAAADLESPKRSQESTDTTSVVKDQSSSAMLSDLHSQATAYSRLVKSTSLVTNSMDELTDESGWFTVLPISAESARLLPYQQGDLRGSDILLEAVVEADVARKAKGFFLQSETQKNE